MKRKPFLKQATVVGIFLAAGPIVFSQAAIGIVTPSNMASIGFTGVVTDATQLQFVRSPSPPFGFGSVQFTINKDNQGGELRLTDKTWNVNLSNLVGLTYDTWLAGKKCTDGDKKPKVAPSIALDIDSDGDFIADDVLVFDPALNGALMCGSWQTWNAVSGLWYLADQPNGPHNPFTLRAYTMAHPNATIVLGGIRIRAGFGSGEWKDIVSNVGFLEVGASRPCVGPVCVDGPEVTYLFSPGS
jgi:hypothetical protein